MMFAMSVFFVLFACGTPEAPPDAADPMVERGAPADGVLTNAQLGGAAADPNHFGAAFTLTGSEPLQTLFDDPTPHMGHDIRVVGEITNVCQAKGCWMVLRADGGESMRITMKDHAFSVAKDASGRTAHVQGALISKAVDQKTIDHYKSEGAGDDVPEEGKETTYELVAVSVLLEPATDAG
jgi:hypothetical protein